MNSRYPSNWKANILVVDDTPENLQLLIGILSEKGYKVRPATNGKRALATAKLETPDLILLDIKMPHMSGYEVCEQLKSDPATKTVPVIFISALDDIFDKVKAFSLGAVDYITKPFQADEVLARIQTHLALCWLQKRLEAQNSQLRKEMAERKKAETGLKELNNVLENQIRKRTADLNQSNANLQAEIRERKRIEKTLKFELEVIEAIANSSSELLASERNIRKICGIVLECAKKLTESQAGYVSVIDQNTGDNVAYAFHGITPVQCRIKDRNAVFPIGSDGKYDGLWGYCLNTLESFYTNDPKVHPSATNASAGDFTAERFLSAPVRIEGHLAGQISLANSQKDYTDEELAFVERLGELQALAIHRHRYETEKVKFQSQIQQMQKMEAIGALAGGIAHDFNNILYPILGYVEMLIEDVGDDMPFVQRGLNEIQKGAKRAGELVQQILMFSRQTEQEVKPLRIQLIIKEVIKLSMATLPSTIKIRQNIDNKCAPVMANPTNIHQIAMNLVTNAFHAMEETGGELTIGLEALEIGPDDVKSLNMSPGEYNRFWVEDSGCGMEKSVLDRVFDPYFSTKPNGKGTGLGLAVVRGIVLSYGGHIDVYSEPGKGSVFNIYLPIMATFKEHRGEMKEPEIVPTGSERILLVDDEIRIIDMARIMLERLGYSVASETSSLEALKTFESDPNRFDLVITDMTMPNMTGSQLAKEILKLKPGIPIILCTGFSEKIDEATAKSLGIGEYIMKPVVKNDLAKAIRRVLGKES